MGLIGALSTVGMPFQLAGTWVVVDVPNCGESAIVKWTCLCVLDQVQLQALKMVALSHHMTSLVSIYRNS